MQYRSGTVTTIFATGEDSTFTILGTDTQWKSYIFPGNQILISDDIIFYTIANVISDTELLLLSPYPKEVAEEDYIITIDFSTFFGFPLIQQGNLHNADIMTRAIVEIDQKIHDIGELESPEIVTYFQYDHAVNLLFYYKMGILRDGVTIVVVGAGSIALTDNTTNYIEIDKNGNVSKNIIEFTAGCIPLYEVACLGGVIDTITDKRSPYIIDTLQIETIDFSFTSGVVSLKDNIDNALIFKQDTTIFMAIHTLDTDERVSIYKKLKFPYAQIIDIKDNDTSSLIFKEGTNAYLGFDTSDGNEKIDIYKNLNFVNITYGQLKDNIDNALIFRQGTSPFLAIHTLDSDERLSIYKKLKFPNAQKIDMKLNSTSALCFESNYNKFLEFDTTNDIIIFHKPVSGLDTSGALISASYFIIGIPEDRLDLGIANGIISLISNSVANIIIYKIEIFAQSIEDLIDDTIIRLFIDSDLGSVYEQAVLTHNSIESDYYLAIDSGLEISANGKIYIRSDGAGGHGNIIVSVYYE